MVRMLLRSRTSKVVDGLWLGALFIVAGFYFSRFFNFGSHPAEDAAMIMRYAEHAASGYGIVWNKNENPVEGATDFFSTITMAGLIFSGFSAELAARWMGWVSHALTCVLVFMGLRLFYSVPRWIAGLCFLYLAFGPSVAYIQSYFTTPYFVFFVTLSWFLANGIVRGFSFPFSPPLFALACLLMGLTRPEGVFMAGLIMAAIIWRRGWKNVYAVTAWFLWVFGLMGSLYFVWRWSYFGYLLPNPFYVKVGESFLSPTSVKFGAVNLVEMAGPFLLAPFAAIFFPRRCQGTVFFLIPILGFIGLWILISDVMNFYMRYHYAVIPILLMSWPEAFPEKTSVDLSQESPLNKICFYGLVGLTAAALICWQQANYRFAGTANDGRYDLGRALSVYAPKKYTMVITEAGLLPFYSKWRAVDAWGLNDERVAHEGIITTRYLAEINPELIMFYAPADLFTPEGRDRESQNNWTRTVRTLERYARENHYKLAAVYGPHVYELHYYFVRPDFSDSEAITNLIQGRRYAWPIGGMPCFNFADSDLALYLNTADSRTEK